MEIIAEFPPVDGPFAGCETFRYKVMTYCFGNKNGYRKPQIHTDSEHR